MHSWAKNLRKYSFDTVDSQIAVEKACRRPAATIAALAKWDACRRFFCKSRGYNVGSGGIASIGQAFWGLAVVQKQAGMLTAPVADKIGRRPGWRYYISRCIGRISWGLPVPVVCLCLFEEPVSAFALSNVAAGRLEVLSR